MRTHRKTEEEAGLADRGVADQEKLEQVIAGGDEKTSKISAHEGGRKGNGKTNLQFVAHGSSSSPWRPKPRNGDLMLELEKKMLLRGETV